MFVFLWVISLVVNLQLGIYAWYLRQKNSGYSIPEPTKRGLFKWNDGVNWHQSDPVATLMDFENHPRYIIDEHSNKVVAGDPEAKKLTVQAVTDVFKVGDYSEPGKPGLTYQEKLDLMQAFIRYCNAQKKNMSALRI
jgi:hypothetical protein